MGVLDQKQDIFGKLAALKTLTEGKITSFKSKSTNSMPSVNNGNDSMAFLVDLLKATRGLENITNDLSNLLSTELPKIEVKIKQGLKDDLKSLVSCQINPSLPSYLKSTSTGINIEIKKIDFYDILHTDPKSTVGPLLYNDANAGVNSKDFNTFLYETIQSDSTTQTWGQSTVNKQIADFTFTSNGTPTNVLNLKANSTYDNKTLTTFNNDFIDSIQLFNPANIVSNVTELLHGTISLSINKSRSTLEMEGKINDVLTKFINAEDDDTVDDSYFTFTNDQVRDQQESATNRANGIRKLITCNSFESTISLTTLSAQTNNINSATTFVEKSNAIATALTTLGNESASNADTTDQNNIKLTYTTSFLQKLIQVLVSEILTPKLLALFVLNDKIINGQNSTFTDPIDFLSKHKSLIKSIVKTLTDAVVNYVMKIIIKEILSLVSKEIEVKLIDMAKNEAVQLLSLIGVPSSVLRLIKGL